MARQDTVASAAATPSENSPVTLSITTADINAMEISGSGGLIIHRADGSIMTIENFKALAEQGATLTLQDGESIDAAKLFEALSADAPAMPAPSVATVVPTTIEVAAPMAGRQAEVTLHEGEKYVFAFDPAAQDMRIENGDLIIAFDNGGVIVIRGYEQISQMDNPPSMQLAGGRVIDPVDVLNLARLAERESGDTTEANNLRGADHPSADEMAAMAQKLAEVQPAAGGEGGGGAASRGGFGFGSVVDPAPIEAIPPIGPLGPTALQFGAPRLADPVFIQDVEDASPPGPPSLNVQGVQVYEDGSVLLSVSIGSNGAANVNTVATITGIPAGWTVNPGLGTYDAVTGTWTITLTGGGTFVGGPTLSPPHNSDVDLSNLTVTVTNTDTTTGLSTSLTGHADVLVDAVADKPDLAVHDASGLEDTNLPVSITTGVTDTDGSESITRVTISGVPAGFILSAGTDLGGGVYELTPAQLAGLTMTPPLHFSGSLTLTVTTFNGETATSGSEFDLTNNANSNTDDLVLTWSPVADVPDLRVQDVVVKEDHSVTLPISATLVDADGSEFLTVTVKGIPVGWTVDNNGGTYNAATGTWTITMAPGLNFSGGPTLHPPHDSDVDSPALTVTATATEIGNGDSASDSGTAFVVVDAVADAPTVDALNNVGNKNAVLDVSISGAVTDLDGSETIVKYQVSGVPAGFAFNKGSDLGGGVWEFTPAQISGLKATSPAGFVGTISLNATVFTAETNISGTETDTGDNTATAVDPFTLQWKPTANPPTVEANLGIDDAIVKEDHSIFVPIKATLDPNGSGNEILTVTVTGINPAWTINNADGTYNAATGTWTITLAPGQNYNGGLTFTPPANSDADMSGLNARATAVEPATGTSASTDDAFRVVTDAVADAPNLTASSPGAEEDHSAALNIATSVNDIDGSEAITKIVISGVPAGGSLNQGTDLGGGSWQLTVAQLTGLKLNPPTGFSGTVHLSVTTTVREINLGGTEVDLLDNVATKTVALDVKIAPDDVPVVQPEEIKVDETNLVNGPVVVNDSIQANFFADTPGVFSTTGVVTSTVPLTSNGVAVMVNVAGETYTGMAGAEKIFTLKLNANGTYTFTLLGTLDHPDKTNANDWLRVNFGFNATDSDGDVAPGSIVVKVWDDGAVAVNDSATVDGAVGFINGNVMTNDQMSQDTPNAVSEIRFGATVVNVPDAGVATIAGAHGVLKIAANGSYTYTLNSGNHTGPGDNFDYVLRDSDGDTDVATLNLAYKVPVFLVGTNVHDIATSTTPYQVGPGNGTITGGASSDILVGDVGGSKLENQKQDYNIVMMLDVSGSMGSKSDPNSRISLLVSAVKNLMADFHDYTNGDIKVHLVPFSTTSHTTSTFTVTGDAGYADILTFLNGLDGNGYTNYEAPMQSAINWLQGAQPISGATTISYFVSDGAPNRFLNNSNQVIEGTVAQVMAQLNGTADGTNEIATLRSLSDEVIGVGINIGANITRIDAIDSNGVSLNVKDAQDLDAALASTNPLNRLSSVGSDHLMGGDGNDLIYGDSMNTDALATAMGLSTLKGAGWDVFARLESGQSTVDPTWNRADTLDYIRTHAEAIGSETLGGGGAGRTGGNDSINGGAGNDVIFGQEGNDRITGGGGNDLIYGGTGEDTFIFNATSGGLDTIKDFDASEGDVLDLSVLLGSAGFDAVNDAINDFVFATDTAQGTIIKVDATGSGNAAAATSIVLLDGVHGVDLNTLISSGALTTV